MTNRRRTGVGLAAATLGLVAVSGTAGAQTVPPPSPVPAPTSGTAPDQVVAVTPDANGLPIAAVFGWHSAQRGTGVNSPVLINGSGGNGYRQMSIGFDQNTYRDVGVPVFGTKTIASTGVTVLHEWTGTAAPPQSSSITDSNTCTGAGISGLEVGLPSGVTVVGGTSSTTQEGRVETGATLHFERNYNQTFQCRVSTATPAKSTRWSAGEMVWKNGSVSNKTSSEVFWW